MNEYTATCWVCGHCGVSVASGTIHYCPRHNGEITYATPQSEEINLLREAVMLLKEIKELLQ